METARREQAKIRDGQWGLQFIRFSLRPSVGNYGYVYAMPVIRYSLIYLGE